MAAAVERVNPSVFRDMVDRSVAIINDGGTADDGTQAIETAAAPLLAEAFKVLPDRQLLPTVRLITETARHIGTQDARMCQDWLTQRPGQPVPVITRLMTPEQRQAMLRWSADALITAADPRQRASSPTQEPPQFQAVLNRLQARLPRAQFAVLSGDAGATHAPATACAATIELFTEILRLPEREAGPLLRYMLNNP